MGMIGMFRRPHWIRRWEKGRIDFQTQLNVQPLNSNDLKTLPEGQRVGKRVKAFGDKPLVVADQKTGQRGDWLYYCGRWYECVSCIMRDHTMVGHYRSEFCLIGESEREENLVSPAGPAKPLKQGRKAK